MRCKHAGETVLLCLKQLTHTQLEKMGDNLPNIFSFYNDMLWSVPPGPACRQNCVDGIPG